MPKIIGVSEARAKLKTIIDRVAEDKEPYILMRGSRPQAAIISFDEYTTLKEQARRQWNDRFDSALARSREIFRRRLIDQGYDPDKLSDDEVAEIIKNA